MSASPGDESARRATGREENHKHVNDTPSPAPTQPTDMLDAALAYAAAGFRVGLLHYPIDGRCSCGKDCGKDAAKHPLTDVMHGGITKFTTNAATIKRWLKQAPDANLGIEPPLGYAFFDVDDVGAMQADGRTWPATLEQRSGRVGGGKHLLYRTNGTKIVNSVKLLPWLDIRGPGSYVVAALSRYITGTVYEGLHPFDLDLVAAAPAWLEALLAERAAKVSAPHDADSADFTFNRDAQAPAKLQALLAADLRFRKTWEERRADFKNDSSPSVYDLAAINVFREAAWTPQEIVDALIARRRERGDKLKPRAYYVTTLTKAGAFTNHEDAPPVKAGRTQAERLVALVSDVDLWRTPEGDPSATFTAPDGHREHHPIASKPFRDLLRGRFATQAGKIPTAQALKDAVDTLSARAESGEVHPAPLRVAEVGGVAYLDLADPLWRAVEITSGGWRTMVNPPVRFRRKPGMLPLPSPVTGGSVEPLRRFVHSGEETFVLIVSWLVGALSPSGPYLVLALSGVQDSGKSFLARLLRLLIDPNAVPLRSTPREERDLLVGACNGHVLALDNLSGLPPWLSDGLCRISTGGGLASRRLYTDADEILFPTTRPVILNGIGDVAARPDLLSRSLLVPLAPLTDAERRSERNLLRDFEGVAPVILGALLDAASAALAHRDEVTVPLPRMADATAWICAATEALPWTPDTFIEAYAASRREAEAVALESDCVGDLVIQFTGKIKAINPAPWSGTFSALLAELDALLPTSERRPLDFPRNPRQLSDRVFRLAPALLARGIKVSRPPAQRQSHKHRTITIENVGGDL